MHDFRAEREEEQERAYSHLLGRGNKASAYGSSSEAHGFPVGAEAVEGVSQSSSFAGEPANLSMSRGAQVSLLAAVSIDLVIVGIVLGVISSTVLCFPSRATPFGNGASASPNPVPLQSQCTQGGRALLVAVAVDMFFLGSALTAALSARVGQSVCQKLAMILALPMLLLGAMPLGSFVAINLPPNGGLILLGAGCAALMFLVFYVLPKLYV